MKTVLIINFIGLLLALTGMLFGYYTKDIYELVFYGILFLNFSRETVVRE
jgi:hypothetical protein